ncbi:hypothetical protein K466DRAFT_359380 [Polyporus arcularius HHB13444]|uniref:Uncharacterized protein n=1 Tax=Polyporus arcularius HHB13444 TaxID=1314778 RepID=A0A5C3P5C6_9APHY|nr:hypothetical protein K466DRAFT_359380 [Polyporus arcularius HHB13444]
MAVNKRAGVIAIDSFGVAMPYRLISSISPQQLSDLAVFRTCLPGTGVADLYRIRTPPSACSDDVYVYSSRHTRSAGTIHDTQHRLHPPITFPRTWQHRGRARCLVAVLSILLRVRPARQFSARQPDVPILNRRPRPSSYFPDDTHQSTACRARRRRHPYLLVYPDTYTNTRLRLLSAAPTSQPPCYPRRAALAVVGTKKNTSAPAVVPATLDSEAATRPKSSRRQSAARPPAARDLKL